MAEQKPKLKLELEGGLIVHWDEDELGALADGGDQRPWHLHGEPGGESSALRVLSARLGDGGLLLIAALRPVEAVGHDAELPLGLSVDSSGPRELAEVLLSTEYDGSGAPRRVGLEIYAEEDSYAVRGAGDTTSARSEESDGWRREIARMDFRLDGEPGVATYEIWHRA